MTDPQNTPAEYIINFTTSTDLSVQVTATDVDDAIEKADEETPRDVCAQCTGWGQKWSRTVGDELEFVEAIVDGEVVETGRTFFDEQRDVARKAAARADRLRVQLEEAQARIKELEGNQ